MCTQSKLKPHYVYVIQCKNPSKYYVGSTYRRWGARIQEHIDGYGSAWTKKYGFGRVVKRIPCALNDLDRLEKQVWCFYARYVCGPQNVRGGDCTVLQEPIPDYLLPIEFGGSRICDWGEGVP